MSSAVLVIGNRKRRHVGREARQFPGEWVRLARLDPSPRLFMGQIL